MAFRSDGTYTQTSESCGLVDDGFGYFYYGWYVANEHICFVAIEEQIKDEEPRLSEYKKIFREARSEGYVEKRCRWKVERIERNKISITETYLDGETNAFTMERRRWL